RPVNPTPPRGEPLRFAFNNAFLGDPSLRFDFQRGQEIAWSGQVMYQADQPRYEPALLLAAAPVLEQVRETDANTDLLGSGLDHDGLTPILILYDRSARLLDVFTVAGDDLLQAEATGAGRNRTDLSGFYKPDLLHGADARRAHEPLCAAICHGLIVMQCKVWYNLLDDGNYWRAVATSFFVSQDAGQSWELFHVDSNVQNYWDRGREWCMQSWWPMETNPTPVQAFFASADYRHNTGAKGGRTYLFGAHRLGLGSPWNLDPVVVLFEDEGERNEHFHTAAAVPLPDGGMAVLTAVGDAQPRNRIVNQRRDDRDYTAPGWLTDERFHGSQPRDLNADPREGTWSDGGAHKEDSGKEGNQFVGCAPGSNLGDVLVGADLASEQIMCLPAADMAAKHPRTQHVYGLGLSNDSDRSEVFLIRTPTPELGGPYVSRYSPQSGGIAPDAGKRLLYSSDGVDWVQLFSPDDDNYSGCAHGEHIYVDSFQFSDGVRRLGLPVTFKRRPLRVGAGGFQRGVLSPEISGTPNGTITALEQGHDGLWWHDGVLLDPQPPTSGRVFHLTSSRHAQSLLVGRVWLSGEATDVGQVVPGDALQLRCWIMNKAPDVMLHPGIELRDTANNVTFLRRPTYASLDHWFPVVGAAANGSEPDQRLQLRVNSSSTDSPEDTNFFLALDSFVEGVGLTDYALPPDDSPDQSGTWYPDELATLSGFQCEQAWTITLAGQLPPDSWDAAIETTDTSPLATLWGDEQNYIELIATTPTPEDCRLVASIVSAGAEVARLQSAPTYWTRGTAVLLSLTDPGDGSGVQMTVSLGAREAQEATVQGGGASASPGLPPTEVRFSSHHGTSGDGTAVHVTPMLWWGGEISPSDSTDAAGRAELLQTLAFLNSTPGDIDGDGDVDQSDLGLLLLAFGIDDGGDLDHDGDTDQADLGILLINYGLGT
ncbi:MAG: hypothetical protein ACF8NJ_09940, partial [Phycisphaerales bacterium JB038]